MSGTTLMRRINTALYQCKLCKIDQPISAFYRNHLCKLGIDTSKCKMCLYQYLCTEPGYFDQLIRTAKNSQKNRYKKKGCDPPVFALTPRYLRDMYYKQNA
eukprot:917290_1